MTKFFFKIKIISYYIYFLNEELSTVSSISNSNIV